MWGCCCDLCDVWAVLGALLTKRPSHGSSSTMMESVSPGTVYPAYIPNVHKMSATWSATLTLGLQSFSR